MLVKIIQFVAISGCVTLLIAGGLILSQRPVPMPDMTEGGLNFDQTLAADRAPARALSEVEMRDGYALKVRDYPAGTTEAPLLILVHGSGWHGLQFDALALALSGQAHVLAPDLRGHGTAPGRRGDVDYIGQLEDDLADLIAAKHQPGQKVVLAGHSSGGGLVVRFAGGDHGALLDGAVLLAPFLKHNAPTMRPNAGGWTRALTRRIIGLSMLNTVGITALNHLDIIQLNMPRAVLDGPLGDTATLAYSYRLNTSFAPRPDYLGDVAALPPFVLIAGAQDEAFDASLYAPTLQVANDMGRYEILPDVGHLDVVDDPRTTQLMKAYLDEL